MKQTNANNARCFFLATDSLGESIFADPGSFGTSSPCRTTWCFFCVAKVGGWLAKPRILRQPLWTPETVFGSDHGMILIGLLHGF